MEYTTTNYESLSSKLNVVCNPVLILLADELLIVPFKNFSICNCSFYSKIYVICLPEICITRLICISLYNNILTPF